MSWSIISFYHLTFNHVRSQALSMLLDQGQDVIGVTAWAIFLLELISARTGVDVQGLGGLRYLVGVIVQVI